jgi:hypothetical protein
VLSPIFEARFSDSSYGFSPGKECASGDQGGKAVRCCRRPKIDPLVRGGGADEN